MRQWRVGTLSMGFLLIALGVIMLVSQIYDVTVIKHIIKWWPVALIMIGIEILVYIFLSKQEEPKVKFDIFSIVIISLMMMASVIAYGATSLVKYSDGFSISSVFDNYKYDSKFKKSMEVEANKTNLVVENDNGKVEVVKGNGKKIEVNANISISNNDEAYAQKIADTLIQVENDKNIQIRAKAYTRNSKIGRIKIDYVVKVPDTINVEVNNKFGDVVLDGIALSGYVNNKNGEVTAKSIGGNLKVDSSFGDVDVEDVKGETELYLKNGRVLANNIQNNIKVENSFGDIEINDIKGIATISNTNGKTEGSRIGGDLNLIGKFGDVIFKEVSGRVDIDEKNGKVDIDGVGKDVKVSNKYGDIIVKNANKGMNIDASNGEVTIESDRIIEQDVTIESKFGDINLKLADGQNGSFDVYTGLGSIESDLGFSIDKNVSKETMKGTLIDDKVTFKLKNDNGDVIMLH